MSLSEDFPGLLYLEKKSEICLMVTFLLNIKVFPCVWQFKCNWTVKIAELSWTSIISETWKKLWHRNNEHFSWKIQRQPMFWHPLCFVAMNTTAPSSFPHIPELYRDGQETVREECTKEKGSEKSDSRLAVTVPSSSWPSDCDAATSLTERSLIIGWKMRIRWNGGLSGWRH